MTQPVRGYIICLKPNRRTANKLTDIALITDSMDINVKIRPDMEDADWLKIPDRNGNTKVWRRRNYATSPLRITTCTALAQRGISCDLKAGAPNTCAQAGWGETVAANGDLYRVLYCYEENIIKVWNKGYFDKTASIFVKADQLRLVA